MRNRSFRFPVSMEVVVVTIALVSVSTVQAEFDLFSADRGRPAEQAVHEPSVPFPEKVPVPSRKPPVSASKPFVLRGTSRIGVHYSAVLQAPDGSEVKVAWRRGQETDVPGFKGYRIDEVLPRRVRLLYPPGAQCLPDEQAGVTCNLDGTAGNLRLVAKSPMPPKVNPAAKPPVKGGDDKAPGEAPLNPFAAALKKAAEGQGRSPAAQPQVLSPEAKERALENFKNAFAPKKIAPEDVPPGMKVVHTPFGDRLVPK